MVPKYPFHLTIFRRNGERQVKTFESLAACVEAAHSLRPSVATGWELSSILETRCLSQPHEHHNNHQHREPVEVIKIRPHRYMAHSRPDSNRAE